MPRTYKKPRIECGAVVFTSVLAGKHDRQHSVDDRFSIFALDSWLLIQITFPKELAIAELEAAEVVLVSITTVSDGEIRDCSCFLCQEN